MKTWILHVENFGKIKSADIETAPMMLFVGDNNSGKSYIMTLIYGLLNTNFFSSQYDFDKQSDNYMICKEFVDEIYESVSGYPVNVELTCDQVKAFEGVLNELLSINKDRFMRDLFNKRVDIGKLSLEFKDDNRHTWPYTLLLSSMHQENFIMEGASEKKYPILQRCCGVKYRFSNREYDMIISFIIEYMIKRNFGKYSVYFPTARTGYVLTYKSLISSALKDKFNLDTAQKNLLTRPNSDFLTGLSGIGPKTLTDDDWDIINRTQSAVSIIENNIVGGQVSFSDMPVHDILYHPQGTNVCVPLFVTSGVVTEMTPLLLFFRNEAIHTVLIEEPEISLHPQLQCEMTRALIRLVNSEISVLVTTHSDIILQHINNMIKLERASNRKMIAEKLGYEDCDWISKEKVKVYQFDVDDRQRTTVTKLPCGEFGFEAMTFYDTMKELSRQTMIIEED